MGDERDAPTKKDIDRASVLEEKGIARTGLENEELQTLWLHRWLWRTLQEKLRLFRNDPSE